MWKRLLTNIMCGYTRRSKSLKTEVIDKTFAAENLESFCDFLATSSGYVSIRNLWFSFLFVLVLLLSNYSIFTVQSEVLYRWMNGWIQ